ncbi:MAG: cupredoxin domain-containing protein [Solirubrobacterales bacterium]
MTQRRFIAPIAVPVALLALGVAGCGSSSNGSTSTTAASTQPASGGGQTETTSADPNGALKFTQTSLTAKAGKVTLQMTNPSSSGVEHGVAVEGNGVDQDGQIVQPGGTSTVSVDLKPGKYEFYCPFDSHKQQGMTGTLTVN